MLFGPKYNFVQGIGMRVPHGNGPGGVDLPHAGSPGGATAAVGGEGLPAAGGAHLAPLPVLKPCLKRPRADLEGGPGENMSSQLYDAH